MTLDYNSKKIIISPENVGFYTSTEIETIISAQSKQFFDRFRISTDFLEKDPETWEAKETYLEGLKIVKNLKVVNDTTEQSVKLITDYNNLLTKDAENKQYMFQILEEYKQRYPTASKSAFKE